MKIKTKYIIICFLLLNTIQLFAQSDSILQKFNRLNTLKTWKLKLEDNCTKNWKSKWFLDGLIGKVTNSKNGMLVSAGSTEKDDANHLVLWTKDSFKGDLKIEFDFTRMDSLKKWVNILYIQATGIGKAPYFTDISQWNDKRKVPTMSTYFKFMNALHISYAAYGTDGAKDSLLMASGDYIRVRKYPVKEGANFNKTTEIPPTIYGTGLFTPNISYHVTVIKSERYLYLSITNQDISKLYSWDLSVFPSVTEGRVGLRLMYGRSSLFKNIKIYTK